jgi:hypothetical protein
MIRFLGMIRPRLRIPDYMYYHLLLDRNILVVHQWDRVDLQ